ncbi:unnamed protein product [Brachionus calyciflorus]|uniref:Uncharacterized protein n=1 Tax=Brachionus calyciflorus TaxID=104777 RepID=A0A813TUK2_9BILA|nr:unnamed protein product [Brachionus calyciflorus]
MDDYISDEEMYEDSDSESISLGNNDHNSNYSQRNQNRQIETLKQLRHCLNENKQLRQRLEIVESELENLLEYKSFLPLVDHSDKGILTEPYTQSPENVILPEPVYTETKSCQADFELPEPKIPTPPPPPPPVVIIKEKTAVIIPKNDSETQCDEDYWTDKEIIKNLTQELDILKQEKELEKENFNLKLNELTLNNRNLSNRLEDCQKSLEISNEKLSEYIKINLTLSNEVDEFKKYKEKFDLCLLENEELIRNLNTRQQDLELANNRIIELTKNLNESFELGEKQKLLIDEMEKKNKDVIERFMDECLKLEKENYELKQDKEMMEIELKKQSESLIMLQKEVDRYKSDLKNFNFKEFVSVKRELNQLKEEKERYFANIVTMPQANQLPPPNQQSSPLPPIKPIKKNVFNFFNN